jgi:hypothetical protein
MASKQRPRRSAPTRRGRSAPKSPPRPAPKPPPKKTKGQTAYQRRIANARAKGKTLQEARGHKPREHVERRERELREGITTYQRGATKRFAELQARRSDTDPGPAIAEFRQVVKDHGWQAFDDVRREVRRLSETRRLRPERRRGAARPDLGAAIERAAAQKSRNIARMEALSERYNIPIHLLFYHGRRRNADA